MQRNIIIQLFLVLLIFVMSDVWVSASAPIQATQGERVTLTLKLINVGPTALNDIKAEFVTPPGWIYPTRENISVNIPANSAKVNRPTALSPHSGLLSGDFRNFYLAVVNPKKTLGVLFESKRGPHGRITRGANAGKPGHPDYFYHDEIWGISVDDAYTLLSLMSTQSPAALRVGRTRTLSFVEKHVKHFAAPRKVSYRPEPVYFQWHDYRVRSAALDTVGFLGTSAEVKLVEEIIRDARDVDLERLRSARKLERYEQIREKGRRIIEQIRQRSPSESETSP